VEALECSAFLVRDPNAARYQQWNWLFQKHNQAHAASFVLSELAVRPPFGTDDMVERAWAAIDSLLDTEPEQWIQEHPLMGEGVWKPLAKLKDKALARRRRAMQDRGMAQRQGPSASLLTGESYMFEGIDIEDAPIDWVSCCHHHRTYECRSIPYDADRK